MADCRIKLTKGKHAIVSKHDYPWLSRFNWYYSPGFGASRNKPKNEWIRGTSRKVLMHRYILNAPDSVQVDHINGNYLDNRRSNLRLASPAQNRCNWRNKPNKWGMRGIYYHKQSNRFVARVTFRRKTITVGYFKTALAARRAYCKAARKYHGEFAWGIRR